MAERFEPYHVPQQSRRDKLRVLSQNQPDLPDCVQNLHSGLLLPLYDSSSLLPSSDLLSNYHLFSKSNSDYLAKNEGASNLMGGCFVNVSSSSSSSSSSSHNLYSLDPVQSVSLPLNPNSIQPILNSNNPLFYTHQNHLHNYRDFDQSYHNNSNGNNDNTTTGHGGGVVGFKPEPPLLTHRESNTNTANGQAALTLSLSNSHYTHQNSTLPLELNLQRYGSAIYETHNNIPDCGYMVELPAVAGGGNGNGNGNGNGSTSNDHFWRSSVPLGPFTGYSSVLKGSRFLKPAQVLLEEICDVGRGFYMEKTTPDSCQMDPCVENMSCSEGIVDDPLNGGENRRKKSRLISMLNEVYKRYRQYYQQMEAVVASFEYVDGLGNAAPYANLALKAMSKHFRCLKNAITDHIQFTSKGHNTQVNSIKDEGQRFIDTERNFYTPSVRSSRFHEHQPVWRPQRGLPERAVIVLRAWLFEHFLHPYPTDTDKGMLAKQTGLSRSQVSNWFINARVRLWKPMVEEIHMLETRQAQKSSKRNDENVLSENLPASSSIASENPSTLVQSNKFHEGGHVGSTTHEPFDPTHQAGCVSMNMTCGSSSSSVSLTLGLHQNNGMNISEAFPITTAQRFGLDLEGNGGGYVSGVFEGQNRQFGRDIIGGQLLHDFVG